MELSHSGSQSRVHLTGLSMQIKLSKAKYHLWYLMPRPRATVPELFSEYLENSVVHVVPKEDRTRARRSRLTSLKR